MADRPAVPLELLQHRARIVAADKRHGWHPYTPMDEYIAETEPLVIRRASGAHLEDLDGRRFIDGNSSWWTMALGHAHPRLVRAAQEQLAELPHVAFAGITHEHAALLAEELLSVAPAGLSRVFYSDDGSTAVEVAVKAAAQYWEQRGQPRRKRFVALDGAFHGETLAPTALGGVEVFRRPFRGLLMDCIHVPLYDEDWIEAFGELEKLLARSGSEIAAVVLEPIVQGVAGMRMYPPEQLRRARELTARYDVLLVCDEVFTGYGRTGPMFACEHAGITPDILCVGKGFTAGLLPMAATLFTEELFDGFRGAPERAFYYGHSYCGHALGARVAREVLAVFREERVLEQLPERAALLQACFTELGRLPGVKATRSLGMIGALELDARAVNDKRADWDLLELDGKTGYLDRSGWQVYAAALERGAYLRPLGNVVYTVPPLNIELSTLKELLQILGDSVRAVLR